MTRAEFLTLISECSEGNADAWNRLVSVIDSVARVSISRAVRTFGAEEGDFDDLLQGFYLNLLQHMAAPLCKCHGETERAQRSYIAKLVYRFACRDLLRRRRDESCEIEALANRGTTGHEYVTEAAVWQQLEEWYSVVSGEEFELIKRQVAATTTESIREGDHDGVSPRQAQRRLEKVRRKCVLLVRNGYITWNF